MNGTEAPAGGIAAPFAKAALEKSQKQTVEPPLLQETRVEGIAALAAKAALKKSEKQSEETKQSDPGQPADDLSSSTVQAVVQQTPRQSTKNETRMSSPVTPTALKPIVKRSQDRVSEYSPRSGMSSLAAQLVMDKSSKQTPRQNASQPSPRGGTSSLAAQVAFEKSHSPSQEKVLHRSPNSGLSSLAAQLVIEKTQSMEEPNETNLGTFFANQTPNEMRSEILRQNYDDSSVAIMAEDLEKENSSGAKNRTAWNEGGEKISDYMGWANQAIKASDSDSVRDFEASRNIVEHYEYDDESTIATNFDDDGSIATAMTPRNNNGFPGETGGYYGSEQYSNYAGGADDPYNNSMTTQTNVYGDAVINMPLNFNQDQGIDLGLSFGGEEGFDGPGEYGSNEMMRANGGLDDGLGGFGRDAGHGSFGMSSPNLKPAAPNSNSVHNDFPASPQFGQSNTNLNRPWGSTPNKRMGNDDGKLDRPWGGGSPNKRAREEEGVVYRGWGAPPVKEPEQPKSKKWFWDR